MNGIRYLRFLRSKLAWSRWLGVALLGASMVAVAYEPSLPPPPPPPPDPATLTKVEVEWDKPLLLKDYDGPNLEIRMRDRSINSVIYEAMIPRGYPDGTIPRRPKAFPTPRRVNGRIPSNSSFHNPDGSVRTTLLTFGNRKTVPKKNGVRYAETQSSMYLLHSDKPTGVKVYYLDAIARLNHDWLVVERGPKTASERADRADPFRDASLNPLPISSREPLGKNVLSQQLLDWYLRLEKERVTMDLNDPAAVKHFHEEHEKYQASLKKAREEKKP